MSTLYGLVTVADSQWVSSSLFATEEEREQAIVEMAVSRWNDADLVAQRLYPIEDVEADPRDWIAFDEPDLLVLEVEFDWEG